MFNVCPNCGEYSVEKIIDPDGPFAVCPYCHYAHCFLQQALFVITGASGTGKTTLCLALIPALPECVVIESDILWGLLPATPEDNYQDYRNAWLRIAKNIGQAGKPIVLCGSALPEQFEHCPERRYFSTLYYLAIVCSDDVLVERLQNRPTWRKSNSPEVLETMIHFNQWLKENAHLTFPSMILYDTSHRSIAETTADVANWIRQRL